MEISRIKTREIEASVFAILENYTEVDERIRPIIHEPRPPEIWKDIEVSLPLNEVYERGDRIYFRVLESGNYMISLNNESVDPAKVIRNTMRDGSELSDNEQGPLQYRTRRLFGDESFKNTYSWTSGDQKNLEIHEGKLRIEIYPENR
jgi:hypothetical protein